MNDQKIKIILPAVRANTRLSQQEFADKIGVSKATVFNWENGVSVPTLNHIRKMSELSGIPIDFIYCEDKS